MVLTPRKAFKMLAAPNVEAAKVLEAFQPYAKSALLRTPAVGDPYAMDDLTAVFLLRVLHCRSPDQVAQFPGDFLRMSDQELHVDLTARMRTLAEMQSDRWLLAKEMRDHVATVLARLPPSPQNPPPALVQDGKVSRDLVAAAVSWLMGFGKVPRDTKAITWKLMAMYASPDPSRPHQGAMTSPEEAKASPRRVLRRHLEAYRVGQVLEREIGAELASLVARRISGDTVLHMATADRVVPTVYQGHLRRAEALLRQIVKAESMDEAPQELGLEDLALCITEWRTHPPRRGARRKNPAPARGP